MINKVILIGNLGNDPEIRYTQSGVAVANFTLATSEQWTGQDGQKQEQTEWHKVVAWRKLAEIIGQYLHKGSRVYIEGKLQTRKWQDQNGNDRYTTEIVAQEMKMLSPRGEGQAASGGGGYQGGKKQTGSSPNNNGSWGNDSFGQDPGPGTGDDVPF